MGRDLLGIEDLERSEIERILETAEHMQEVGRREVKKVPTLRGRTIINLFFESSTRTRTSFEIAGKRLSADVVNFSPSSSSTDQGRDASSTPRKTLDAMDPDAVVVRHKVAGVPKRIADVLAAPVINAGDGAHEHPTQALLDLLHGARRRRAASTASPSTIVGDILHSRVARSNIYALHEARRRGARRGAADDDARRAIETLGVKAFTSLREALDGADVVMVLRIQHERLEGAFFPSIREYAATFGVDRAKLRFAKDDAIVMHPGPINRGVEISHDLADQRPERDPRPGAQRRRGAHGGALPVRRPRAARRAREERRERGSWIRGGRVLDPGARARRSRATCWSRTAASRRSARASRVDGRRA